MKIACLRERAAGERRVALTPEAAKRLANRGHQFVIETDAGREAGFFDEAYADVGCQVVATVADALQGADLLAAVQSPEAEISEKLPRGLVLIALLDPLRNEKAIQAFADRGVSAFAMELVPRIARAQRMDALSSQSSLAGYKAVLLGANSMSKFMPMMMTAAGTIPPAKTLILGAGVAGLQAIATARRLGAQVEAFDVRAATKEQVESLGATFVEVPEVGAAEGAGGYARELSQDQQERQRQVIAERAAAADLVVTTALIPGRPAPKLISESAVKGMRPGSVIVDLAAPAGGNCELCEPGETVARYNVIIHAPLNVPSLMPFHASQMYARNVGALVELMGGEDGALALNFDDEIIRDACAAHDGRVVVGGKVAAAPAATGTS